MTNLWQQQAVIEALTGAVGEIFNDFCGLRISRLTDDVPQGSTVLPVERTLGWPDTGRITIDGAVYHYTANYDGALVGVYYLVGGVQKSGTRAAHKALTAVIDASQTYSGLDLLRRGFLSAYAEGSDLDALGRNLGVLRLPDIRTDDQFRKIVQAMAYNPKGTIYGIELALDALVGPGNYTIVEDLESNPGVVQINIPATLFLEPVSQGKTYLTGATPLIPTSGTFRYAYPGATPTHPYARVESIVLSEINAWTDCRAALPSASLETRYDGDVGVHPWSYTGTSTESSSFGLATPAIGFYPLANHVATYTRNDPILATSKVHLKSLMAVTNATSLDTSTTNCRQWAARIRDGTRDMAWGLYRNSPSTYSVVLINPQTGSPISGAVSSLLTSNIYYEIEIRAVDAYAALYVNGALIDRQPRTAFPTTATADVSYGIVSPSPSLPIVITRYVGSYVTSPNDFWSASGTTASVATSAPTTMTVPASLFVTGDVGKQVRISGSAVVNAQGGNNNCVMQVATYVSSTKVTLVTPSQSDTAQVNSTNPTRITVPNNVQAFVFPDDLGKTITLENSTLGNGGTYVITSLLDPNTLANLSDAATKIASSTNVAVVSGASFVPETGLSYHLTPAFVNETGLSYNLSDAGSITGPDGSYNYVIMPRQTLPYANAGYDVTVNNVLSAQVLGTNAQVNALQSLGPPPRFSYWPFYVISPYNFVELYMQSIVAAGIKVVFWFY